MAMVTQHNLHISSPKDQPFKVSFNILTYFMKRISFEAYVKALSVDVCNLVRVNE